jgi:hypothetical protein
MTIAYEVERMRDPSPAFDKPTISVRFYEDLYIDYDQTLVGVGSS